MKKLVLLVLSMLGLVAYAGVEGNFTQYDRNDFSLQKRDEPDHDSWSQALMSLKVSAGTGVWLTNYVQSWGWATPTLSLDGNTFDLSGSQKYGYISHTDLKAIADAKGVDFDSLKKEDYQDRIKWANGYKTSIVYNNQGDNVADIDKPAGAYWTASTDAYFLDYFENFENNENKEEIYLVLTTLEGEVVDAYQYTAGGANDPYDTSLQNRQYTAPGVTGNSVNDQEPTNAARDKAGNIRINYGFNNAPAREFVFVYDDGTYSSELERASYAGSTGGPLPGVFFAGLLSLGTVFGASKAKRQKRA